MDDLLPHNLITFKSHHETLDAWAIKELIGHYVAYRKLVSPTTSNLLPEDQFRLYAVCARFPRLLSGQIPWDEQLPGVYHCQWGTDKVRVIVAGELRREKHNAPLQLFSASPDLVQFAGAAVEKRSSSTSRLLGLLIDGFRNEGLTMSITVEEFLRDQAKRIFNKMSVKEKREVIEEMPPEERQEILKTLPVEEQRAFVRLIPTETLLGGIDLQEIQRFLDKARAGKTGTTRTKRKKK